MAEVAGHGSSVSSRKFIVVPHPPFYPLHVGSSDGFWIRSRGSFSSFGTPRFVGLAIFDISVVRYQRQFACPIAVLSPLSAVKSSFYRFCLWARYQQWTRRYPLGPSYWSICKAGNVETHKLFWSAKSLRLELADQGINNPVRRSHARGW